VFVGEVECAAHLSSIIIHGHHYLPQQKQHFSSKHYRIFHKVSPPPCVFYVSRIDILKSGNSRIQSTIANYNICIFFRVLLESVDSCDSFIT